MLRTLVRRLVAWHKLGNDVARMKRLDDALLADIGVEREDISAFVRGKAFR